MDNQNNNNYYPSGTSGCAVASMILGIIALCLSCCFYYVSLPCAVLGVILGAVGIKSRKGGRGMGIAGLVCSIISLVPAILVIAFGTSLMEMI
ncbi:MAG: DUF4190 domain-containing protein [Ruminococcus sp.]|nr:DUF4190 domain-containing protein [Ruminococcus sp.]